MKLIETPITSNLNIKTFYPQIISFFFRNSAIKFYKFFSLDRTQILLVDTYDRIQVIMINPKKKITKQEIDCAVKRVLKAERETVNVHIGVKQELERAGVQFKRPNKDIVIIEQSAVVSS
ncbi:hypothetical protein A5844_001995 [Enterococcus sp. 10A9_DIV0425]|uniref:DUF1827 domain-containing protein n=1 Tax=Candidatus Enterococcus wittei TaxID=1987383 RepID=A0A242JYA2_9ENTE|nr:DUF1827 family protein [Enterococcus sp. 10A9_DIV0425]OTP10292.1 hypothetical protein A5844_001991 [Enterococcus sp. 10A9_DIV0425]OTP10296.1 hypothetical protein A5844_001995 [Enterococcus sp. 10A9_DIV0425]THE10911.1 DUF1827 family protein [Enterococcus hirae]